MPGWKLEILKMAMYLAFPVSMFHIFNQPVYFEEWVTKKKRELYPPENLAHRELIEKTIRDHRAQHDFKMLKALEDFEKKEKA